ncbi:MAG TPA: nitroreductase family deazaflavin-dependent oxidoreductase [Candidatus Dormibacteraeota bacterium]|jgi:deazaflavin-dependent oxidoreductase (nitroreductase family)
MAGQVESQIEVGDRGRVPGFVRFFNGVTGKLIGAGVPMGPNALLTVRGRKSGASRTTPVSVIEVGGRRWVQGTWGESHWVRNLRAAGEATLTMGKRAQPVKAAELTREEAAMFFSDVLGPYVRKMPFGTFLIGSVLQSRDILDDPRAAAERHPVFELHSAD